MNDKAPVVDTQQMGSMIVTMRVGESVSFDNGRVVVKLEAKSGQIARLNLKVDQRVKFDKPAKR